MIDRKHIGAQSEMIAAAWLLAQGYEVFRNVSQHGLADIIATFGDEVSRFDVKSRLLGREGHLSDEQAALGVKMLLVRPDGSCDIVEPVERPKTRRCANPACGLEFKITNGRKIYCCRPCNRAAFAARQ